MRQLINVALVCVCAVFLFGAHESLCEEEHFGSTEEASDSEVARPEEQERKDGKLHSGGTRRSTVQSTGNGTRDSQLLSLLAARRRQLLHGRLSTHVNTIASLATKPRNTTFAQLEVRHANNTIVKKITFSDNSSTNATPTLELITSDGSKEIVRHDIKPHEIRHIFIPKLHQDVRSRTGLLNNRRRDVNANVTHIEPTQLLQEGQSESLGILYVPPEDDKLYGPDKEVVLDPEEEFQVDESNHGLYLLNYSDTTNLTGNDHKNDTVVDDKIVDNTTIIHDITPLIKNETSSTKLHLELTEKPITTSLAAVVNNTETKIVNQQKIEVDKDKGNQTLFMSDEIYNHFRPLETELPAEDMAPFIYFGQKLGGPVISDNLTNSPSLSASTKSVNFIAAPIDKRKFNSRYSATEKYKNSSADEDEVNEDMDVSVVKNIIEKNKVRNTVKGPAPARHVGLVNAYRKHSTSTTSKPLNISELNVTETISTISTPATIDRGKDTFSRTNVTNSNGRNYTRGYYNLRRRPARITALSTENSLLPHVNVTTEKASTLVYTAVVTSVSITSSMKGHNKTDSKEGDNSTVADSDVNKENVTITKIKLLNENETSIAPLPQTYSNSRPYKHKIRIRTTTTNAGTSETTQSSTPYVFVHRPTDLPDITKLSTIQPAVASKNISDLKPEAISSRFSERLATLYRQSDTDKNYTSTEFYNYRSTTIKPQNILKKRRRPTTASTPAITTPTTAYSPFTILSSTPSTTPRSTASPPSSLHSQEITAATLDTTFKPFVVTSRTSSESSTKAIIFPMNTTSIESKNKLNNTQVQIIKDEMTELPDTINEEVVIEAEKSHTASYVLAGLGFVPVAAIVIFVLRNFLSKKTKEIDTEYEGYFDDSDVKKESQITPVARPPMPPPIKSDQKWEFPRNKLRLQTLLGQGNFGQVWKAEADDLTGHDGLTRLVAVKSIKETASQKEKQELLHEIYIMQKIGTHPNVVTLLACCTEQEPYLLIMEYVMCGKLLTYLRERRSRPDRFSGSGAVTSRDLTVFAYCVARGMDYITSKGIVHRDLAARNVLVDHNKLCKIADFGMSRESSGEERSRPPQRHALPVRWMAPEALLYNAYNHETDVWAYGILLWEIVTLGSTPYAAMSGREVLSAVTEGYRLERPPHCKPQLYHAMHACWNADPTQRPTFATLKAQLAELLDNEPAEGHYVDLDSFYQESSVYSDPSAIIHDDEGLSSEYDRERRCFRELAPTPAKFDKRDFTYREEDVRTKYSMSAPRMCGFGIRDVSFNDRNFTKSDFNDRTFNAEKSFTERNFTTEKSFNDRNFRTDDFNERAFGEKNFTFNERSFNDQNFNDLTFNLDPSFTERKDGKLSTSSFHRERERENPLVSRNSFSGFPRVGTRDNHFQKMADGRNKRVPEFECDI